MGSFEVGCLLIGVIVVSLIGYHKIVCDECDYQIKEEFEIKDFSINGDGYRSIITIKTIDNKTKIMSLNEVYSSNEDVSVGDVIVCEELKDEKCFCCYDEVRCRKLK